MSKSPYQIILRVIYANSTSSHCYFLSAGISIGRRYARTDEIGVPFAVTVDSATEVTIRERDSKQQVRVGINEVASVVKQLTEGQSTWTDVEFKYPSHIGPQGDQE